MIIECKKAISGTTGKDLGNDSPWLKIGKQYIVYALKFSNNPNFMDLKALIESEDYQAPGFFNLNQFTIVSSKIPTTWEITMDDDGYVMFMPKSWFGDEFWSVLGEDDLAEWEPFHREKELILREEPEYIEYYEKRRDDL